MEIISAVLTAIVFGVAVLGLGVLFLATVIIFIGSDDHMENLGD